jgi:hypothetical protein
LVSPDRDTEWLIYNPKEFSFVEYTPSYGGAFETPLARSLDDTVGTVGSRMGTIGDQQGTIGDRGTLESIVGTISRPPTPRPIERRESITPEVVPEPAAAELEDVAEEVIPDWLTPEELDRLEPGFIPGRPTERMEEWIDRQSSTSKGLIRNWGRSEIAQILGPEWNYQRVQDDPIFQQLVERHQKSVVDELRSEIEAARESEIVIAVPERFIGTILDEGRYKSQFETNKSGGLLNKGYRSSFEESALGVSPEIDPTARPLYAFVDTLDGDVADRIGEQYGDGRIHLKSSSKQRATLTLGDSLDNNAIPVSFFGEVDDDRVLAASGLVPSSQKTKGSLYDAALSMLDDGSLGDDADVYGPLLQKIVTELDPDFTDTAIDQTAYYTEAQVHGQVRIDDIELITLPDFYEELMEDEDQEWLKETIAVIERNGIPYRFGNDGDIVTPERPAAVATQEPKPVSSGRTYDPFDTSAPDYDPTRDPFSDSFIGFQDETPAMDMAGEEIPEVSTKPSPRFAEFSEVTDYESFGESGRQLSTVYGREQLEQAGQELRLEKAALEKTISEWRQTGIWNGGTNGVALPRTKEAKSGITRNISKEDLVDFGDSEELENTFAQYVNQIDRQLQHVDGRLADLDEIESGKVVSSINEMTIRDLPNYEELVERGKEIRRVHSTEMTDALQEADPDHVWVLHTGSSTLDGGVLDPNFTLGAGGDGTGLRRTMDTRRANQSNMDRMARAYEDAQKNREAWATALSELEETGNWNGSVLDEVTGGAAMGLGEFIPASSLTQQQRDDLKDRVQKIVRSFDETMDTFQYAYDEITAGNTYLSYYGIRSPGTGYVRTDSPTSTMYLVRVPKDEAYSGFPTAEYQIFGARKPVVSYEFRSQTEGGAGDSLYAALALMEQSALSSVSPERPSEVATPAPRAPRPTPESKRDEGFTKISVNPDEVESMRESLENTLFNKYLSQEEKNLPAVDKVRLLSERMGIRFEQPADEMIDSAISQFEAGQRIDKSLDVIRAVPLDSPKYARTRKLIEQMEEVQEMVKTEEGRAAIRERMAEGLISSLSAQEDIYNRYPIMRANNVFGIMPNSETSHLHAAGVASTGVVNGMITLRYRIGAHSLIMGSLEVDGIEDGDIFSDTLRVAGTRSYQIALASHELGHHAHMIASLRRKGLEPSSTKSFIEQLKEQGPLLEDSLAGVKLAALRKLPLSTRLDDLDEDQRKTLGDYAVGGWKEMPREKRLERDSDAWEESIMFQTVYGGTRDRVIGRAIAGEGFDDSWLNVPEELATPESLAAFVEQRLGMPAAEFARQLHESIIDDIGVDPRRIASNGLTVAEMEEVFKSISDYGASTWTEGVAETFSLQFLRDKLSDVRIDQNIMTQYDSVMANILEGIEGDMREVRISNKTKELLRLIDDLNNDPLVRGLEEDLL